MPILSRGQSPSGTRRRLTTVPGTSCPVACMPAVPKATRWPRASATPTASRRSVMAAPPAGDESWLLGGGGTRSGTLVGGHDEGHGSSGAGEDWVDYFQRSRNRTGHSWVAPSALLAVGPGPRLARRICLAACHRFRPPWPARLAAGLNSPRSVMPCTTLCGPGCVRRDSLYSSVCPREYRGSGAVTGGSLTRLDPDS